jgi:ribosomal-protein-alanine N-acetyltransferase
MQYFIQEPFTRLKQAQTYIENARQQQQIRERVTWTAVHKEQQQVIGRINLHSWRRQHQCVEVGYILGHANWGQGYGTEMLRGVVRYVFRNTAVNRIEANCLSDNHASYRVMEKAGMSFEGIARQRYFINNIYQDVRRYAILKEDYLSPQSTYL